MSSGVISSRVPDSEDESSIGSDTNTVSVAPVSKKPLGSLPEIPAFLTKETDKKKKDKKDKKDKKEKKGKKKRDKKLREEGLMYNARGELVTLKEHALEQTLESTNKSLDQCRERISEFIRTNEVLQQTCTQQEKDALDVIAALHQDGEEKENINKALLVQIDRERLQASYEKEAIIKDYEMKLSDMTVVLNEKEAAAKVMQQEFSVIKDFRRKRHELLKELENQKLELQDTEKRHKEVIARMERKFFEEKIRLQKDANQKISELAMMAHKEAVANLSETTKEVYKENLRMAEALRHHVQEGEDLSRRNSELVGTNRHLAEENDLHNVIVKQKIVHSQQQSAEIKDLQNKIRAMEASLSHVVREFEHERKMIRRLAHNELSEVRKEADRLRSLLERRTTEMRHIKRLAQHVLDQRTDLEKFFLDALDDVRKEIAKEREQGRRASVAEQNEKLRTLMAANGIPVPAIEAVQLIPENINDANSTSELQLKMDKRQIAGSDDKKADATIKVPEKVEISELTLADKERILRLLFAKMNGITLGDVADRQAHRKNKSVQEHDELGERDSRIESLQTYEPDSEILRDTTVRGSNGNGSSNGRPVVGFAAVSGYVKDGAYPAFSILTAPSDTIEEDGAVGTVGQEEHTESEEVSHGWEGSEGGDIGRVEVRLITDE
ncbi:hypothetical protein BJ742DRAFT_772166 [Cladochytrium replicatum]|nr:hypothetical protein BJ742DRAFT_772166 [Cladochytrium replicatum]